MIKVNICQTTWTDKRETGRCTRHDHEHTCMCTIIIVFDVILHPKCGEWVGACAMRAKDCLVSPTHPPTHPPLKLTIPYAGVLDVKGRHRSWQMQPRTWKSNQLTKTVRKTNPSNPSSGEAKRTVSDRTFFQIHSVMLLCMSCFRFDVLNCVTRRCIDGV